MNRSPRHPLRLVLAAGIAGAAAAALGLAVARWGLMGGVWLNAGALVVLPLMVRLRWRGRAVGRGQCVRCGYAVTPVGPVPASCPECGQSWRTSHGVVPSYAAAVWLRRVPIACLVLWLIVLALELSPLPVRAVRGPLWIVTDPPAVTDGPAGGRPD